MLIPPQPRFLFYNGIRNYKLALRDFATGRAFSGDAIKHAEQRIAKYLDVSEVILAPQGRYAIYLGLCDVIKPGQQVIMSPYTLYDVVNMVVAAGGVPCFADIEEHTCNISPEEVERLIGPETGAVLVTHLHGLVAPLDRIRAICARRGVPLLEDACQAFGAQYRGRKAGTIGSMGFFSCGRAKNINAFLGGMIATNDLVKAARIRRRLAELPYESSTRLLKRIAHCGFGQVLTSPIPFRVLTYWIFRYGVLNGVEAVTRQFDTEINPALRRQIPEHYERRMTQTQARLILDQIDRVDGNSHERTKIARIYHEGLVNLPGLVLPPLGENLSHTYMSFPIQVEDREGLQKYMMRHGRDVVVQHIGNVADYGCFEPYRRDCPNARRTAARVLLLPTYPGYRPSEARKNVAIIRRYLGSRDVLRAHHSHVTSESSAA
jgi:perosamine synthetase